MQHESNNINNQLAGMQSVPEGFGFNSNKVWQNIEDGLQPKKKKRFVWWYVAAAALLMAFVFLMPSSKHDQSIVVKNPTQNNVVSINPVTQKDAVTSTTNEVVIGIKSRHVQQTPVKKVIDQPQKDENVEPVKHVVMTTIDTAITIRNPATAVANNDAPKVSKKLIKVLHVNELNMAPSEYADAPVRKKKNNNWLFNHTNDDSAPSETDVPVSKKSIFTIPISTN